MEKEKCCFFPSLDRESRSRNSTAPDRTDREAVCPINPNIHPSFYIILDHIYEQNLHVYLYYSVKTENLIDRFRYLQHHWSYQRFWARLHHPNILYRLQLRKAWTFNINPRFLIHRQHETITLARGSYAPAANVATGFGLRDRTDLRADPQ